MSHRHHHKCKEEEVVRVAAVSPCRCNIALLVFLLILALLGLQFIASPVDDAC